MAVENVKLCTIADVSVPKTALLIAYTTDESSEFGPVVFDNYSKELEIDGVRVQLSLWDTSGQEDYDRLRPLSYPGTDIFLISFSVVNPASFENITSKWIPEIKHHCPNAVVLLLGCKQDLQFEYFEKFNNSEKKFVRSNDGEFLAVVTGAFLYAEIPNYSHSVLNPIFEEGVKEVIRRRQGKSKNAGFACELSPLQIACLKGTAEDVKMLMKQYNLKEKTQVKGETLLHLASRAGNTEVVSFLYNSDVVDNSVLDATGMSAEDSIFANGVVGSLGEVIAHRTHTSSKSELALEYVAKSSAYLESVGLENVLLLPIRFFFEMKCIPHFEKCLREHITASQVQNLQNVLFLSHRWEGIEYPDEHNIQYNLAIKFLESSGINFDYIWVDYSCICQDKKNPAFLKHLMNIPTAVFVATHVLVIPKTAHTEGLTFTDLQDYSGRGWCQLEALLCFITGCKAWITFDANSETEFIPVGIGSSIFTLSADTGWRKWETKNIETAQKLATQWWGQSYREPRQMITAGVLALAEAGSELQTKIFRFEVTTEDCSSGKLKDAFDTIGVLTSDDDRILILRVLLCSLSFCMGYQTGYKPPCSQIKRTPPTQCCNVM